LERSTIGLYQSLLWQLMDKRPDLRYILDTIQRDDKWTVELLQYLFEKTIQDLGKTPVICLIDALDECDELHVRDMVCDYP
jgi:hypothetical protein